METTLSVIVSIAGQLGLVIKSLQGFFYSMWVNLTEGQAILLSLPISVVGVFWQIKGQKEAEISNSKAQFEHKLLYEGWKKIQSGLFDYQSALREYHLYLNSLRWGVDDYVRANSNSGTVYDNRVDLQLVELRNKIEQAYLQFLTAYEGHEKLFSSLDDRLDSLDDVYQEWTDNNLSLVLQTLKLTKVVEEGDIEKQKTLLDKIEQVLEKTYTEIGKVRRRLQNFTFSSIIE